MAGQVFLTYWEERLADGRWVMHKPGEKVTASGDVLARLVRIGAVSTNVAKPVKPEPVKVAEPEPDKAPSVDRPLKTAKLERWQAYARSIGVDAGKLSKIELIAKIGDR